MTNILVVAFCFRVFWGIASASSRATADHLVRTNGRYLPVSQYQLDSDSYWRDWNRALNGDANYHGDQGVHYVDAAQQMGLLNQIEDMRNIEFIQGMVDSGELSLWDYPNYNRNLIHGS